MRFGVYGSRVQGSVFVESLVFRVQRLGLWVQRDWYLISGQPAPAPHLAHPEVCAALRIVPVNVPRVSRSCDHFPEGFDLHLLLSGFSVLGSGSGLRFKDHNSGFAVCGLE